MGWGYLWTMMARTPGEREREPERERIRERERETQARGGMSGDLGEGSAYTVPDCYIM